MDLAGCNLGAPCLVKGAEVLAAPTRGRLHRPPRRYLRHTPPPLIRHLNGEFGGAVKFECNLWVEPLKG